MYTVIILYVFRLCQLLSSGVSVSQLCYRRVSRDQRSSFFVCFPLQGEISLHLLVVG